jgi:hypothetical protein
MPIVARKHGFTRHPAGHDVVPIILLDYDPIQLNWIII